jgi:hypothetical protein
MSDLYPKIHSPFKRHTEGPLRNKLDTTTWARPEFEILARLDWEWTEKVDGTNVRVIWDGYRVTLGGRTDNAQMPAMLVTVLQELFPETLLEQQFGASPAILHGEGYGPKIQKGGGNYRPDQGFVLFDVKVGPWWLLRDAVEDVAAKMSLDVVPIIAHGGIRDAIDRVVNGLSSSWGDFSAEGLVGRPPLGITGRDGDRLLVKVKAEDFVT